MKPQYSIDHTFTSSKFGLHQDSHTISKCKPKIRIIHIFAPEIINTDVEHFRELVQRLTGKPSSEDQIKGKAKKSRDLSNQCPKPSKNIAKLQADHENQMFQNMKKETQEIFGSSDSSSNNSYLQGLEDMNDCFSIQDLVEYPLQLQLPYKSSSQISSFGEMSFTSNRLC